jgi:hypothetical protein
VPLRADNRDHLGKQLCPLRKFVQNEKVNPFIDNLKSFGVHQFLKVFKTDRFG